MTTHNRLSPYFAAVAADNAWHDELIRIFGRRNAANVRYQKAGRGDPGSNLRYLYDARTAAQEAWRRALDPV